ncbi:MAG TPA: D-alanyl-D-alanine carboxypeptidase family protein [Burkholderiales bacterium]|nr:D-alanyl-D-alanine carboxypeptidase family protein [Burkholderiales bacterium]
MRTAKPLLLLFLLFPSPLFAQQLPVPQPPSIAAKSYLLTDYYSKQILVGQNINTRIEPASLTKLMTAYLTFAALKQKQITLEQQFAVSTHAWHAEGSRMFIEPGKPVKVEDLIRGMVVESGNDACIALAEGIAGSEEAFTQMMNSEAQRLGMKNTHFMNSTGLPDPQHYSTAYDLSLLAAAVIRDFPEYYSLYSIKEYKYNNIEQFNRNRLLWTDPYVDGLKTGYTENAGYCLISTAKRGSRRLIAVVLDTASDNLRATESQKLLNYGFQFYDTLHLYTKGQPVTTFTVWKGAENTVEAGFPEDVYLSLPKGQSQSLKATMESRQPLIAPISTGQTIGVVKLTIDGKPVTQHPLVALDNVEPANILVRGWDSLRLLFN